MKILAIDDNPDIIELMKMVIEAIGHDFDSADGGKAGLEKIRKEKYDIVFLDLSMPDMMGNEVIDILYKEKLMDRQKIILFTASYIRLEELDKDLKKKGIYAILSKPADFKQIREKIDEIENLKKDAKQ